jgi:hypothetical protein
LRWPAAAGSDELTGRVEKILGEDGLLEPWEQAPVDLAEPPHVPVPRWPCVIALVVDHGELGVEKLRGALRDLEQLVIHHQLFVDGHLEPGKTTCDVPAKPLLYIAFGLRTASDTSEALGWAVETWLASAPCSVAEPRENVPILVRKGVDEAPILGGIDADGPGGVGVSDYCNPARFFRYELRGTGGFQS